jgi:hypothetical protein
VEQRQNHRIGDLKIEKHFKGPRKSVDFWGEGVMSVVNVNPTV